MLQARYYIASWISSMANNAKDAKHANETGVFTDLARDLAGGAIRSYFANTGHLQQLDIDHLGEFLGGMVPNSELSLIRSEMLRFQRQSVDLDAGGIRLTFDGQEYEAGTVTGRDQHQIYSFSGDTLTFLRYYSFEDICYKENVSDPQFWLGNNIESGRLERNDDPYTPYNRDANVSGQELASYCQKITYRFEFSSIPKLSGYLASESLEKDKFIQQFIRAMNSVQDIWDSEIGAEDSDGQTLGTVVIHRDTNAQQYAAITAYLHAATGVEGHISDSITLEWNDGYYCLEGDSSNHHRFKLMKGRLVPNQLSTPDGSCAKEITLKTDMVNEQPELQILFPRITVENPVLSVHPEISAVKLPLGDNAKTPETVSIKDAHKHSILWTKVMFIEKAISEFMRDDLDKLPTIAKHKQDFAEEAKADIPTTDTFASELNIADIIERSVKPLLKSDYFAQDIEAVLKLEQVLNPLSRKYPDLMDQLNREKQVQQQLEHMIQQCWNHHHAAITQIGAMTLFNMEKQVQQRALYQLVRKYDIECSNIIRLESHRLIASATAALCLAIGITLLFYPVAPIMVAGFSMSMLMIPLVVGGLSALYSADCHLRLMYFANLSQDLGFQGSARVSPKPSSGLEAPVSQARVSTLDQDNNSTPGNTFPAGGPFPGDGA